jgi:hypothetical protein
VTISIAKDSEIILGVTNIINNGIIAIIVHFFVKFDVIDGRQGKYYKIFLPSLAVIDQIHA